MALSPYRVLPASQPAPFTPRRTPARTGLGEIEGDLGVMPAWQTPGWSGGSTFMFPAFGALAADSPPPRVSEDPPTPTVPIVTTVTPDPVVPVVTTADVTTAVVSGGGESAAADQAASDMAADTASQESAMDAAEAAEAESAAADSPGMGDSPAGPYADGGWVTRNRLGGDDPPGPDDGYASLDTGEFVVRADQAQRHGDTLEAINEGDYDDGGIQYDDDTSALDEDQIGGMSGAAMAAKARLASLPMPAKSALATALMNAPMAVGALLAVLGPNFAPLLAEIQGGRGMPGQVMPEPMPPGAPRMPMM